MVEKPFENAKCWVVEDTFSPVVRMNFNSGAETKLRLSCIKVEINTETKNTLNIEVVTPEKDSRSLLVSNINTEDLTVLGEAFSKLAQELKTKDNQ